MRQKYKKILFAGTATTLAGVLGIGALLTSHLSVQASPEMMPGIETIVEKTSKEAPFRILEIVDDPKEAEIGWYVSGQEPYIKLYSYTYTDKNNISHTMTFSTLEEGLAKLPTKTLRQEFANNFTYQRDAQGNIMKDENGNKIVTSTFKDVSYASYTGIQGTNEEDYPLSYTPYQEKYHLEQGDAEAEWKRVDFGEIRTEKIKGHYVKNPTGTGDYTKEEQLYYPVREDSPDDVKDKEGLFRENIKNFLPSESPEGGGNAPYHLVFQEVDNAEFNNNLKDLYDPAKQDLVTNNPIWQAYDYTKKWNANGDATDGDCYGYGYYENKYEALTTAIVDNILPDTSVPSNPEKKPIHTFPGEKPVISVNGKEVSGIYVPQSKLFDSGTITVPSAEEPIIENEISVNPGSSSGFGEGNISGQEPGSDLFGDGEITAAEFSDDTFSSGTTNSGEDFSFEETNPSEQMSGAGQEDVFSASLEEEPVITEEEVLFGYANVVAAGSQGNPRIYLAEQIPDFPFYKYRELGDLQLVKQEAVPYSKDKPYIPDENSKLNISINKNGQYLYWTPDELNPGNWISQELFLVTGRQPVAYENLQLLPEGTVLNYNYYYKVVESYFCCKKSEINQGETLKPEHYKFYGWYYPVYPVNEPQYIPEGVAPTHYISDAIYKLTPGKGDYDFVPDENGKEYLVEVDHLFYRGGYKNHDWFKKYVFNLKGSTDPSKPSEWDKFAIDVTTVTSAEFEGKFVNQTTTMAFTDELAPAGADADFTDAETVPVEPLISESQETALTGELFTDIAQMEDDAFISGEGTASDTNQINESFEEEPAFETSQNEAAFTSKATPAEPVKLSDFDLIYINGVLSLNSADLIAGQTPMIPCIINQSKMVTADDTPSEMVDAFKDYIKNTDKDQHYVTKQVYVFKNTWETTDAAFSLLNLQFHKNFNPNAEADGNGGTVTNPGVAIEGFEEILEYIEKENQYRQIGSTGTATAAITDGTTPDPVAALTDGKAKVNVPLLDKKLSHARAIEYILNFNHKRKDMPSGPIRVLELQPGKPGQPLKKADVLRWMGYGYTVTTCCHQSDNHSSEGPIRYLQDGSADTWWHSAYNKNGIGFHSNTLQGGGLHTITITMDTPCDFIKGLTYTPRKQLKEANGTLQKYSLVAKDKHGNVISKVEGEADYTNLGADHTVSLEFPNTAISGVKEIYLTFLSSHGSQANKHASCAELGLIYEKAPEIQIDTMSTSEFVGHIEDVNTQYNMIYLGDDGTNLNEYYSFRPDDRILYYHIGKNVLAKTELQGLMDHDYVIDKSGKRTGTSRIGKTDSTTNTIVGSVRGSGNDITRQVKTKLVNFAKSGYPVIVAGDIYDETKVVNTSLVDSSSYIYDFLNEIKEYKNVYRSTDFGMEGSDFGFYVNLPKPKIDLISMPPSAIGDQNGPSAQYLEGSELSFEFQIIDEAQVSPVNATYMCELYLDLNCDGNYSQNEQMNDIIIRQNGKEIPRNENGKYILHLNTGYHVSRTIPLEYIKLIPWKLVVTNCEKPEIRTSQIGYTKRRSDKDVADNAIKVLQILPNSDDTWNLKKDTEFKNLFKVIQSDFHVKIDTIKVKEFEDPTKIPDKSMYLKQYHMIIVGFCDGGAYGNNYPSEKKESENKEIGNFSQNGAAAILDFAKSGRSVIFAHDNTSSYNYDRTAGRNNTENSGDGIWIGWAYYFNDILRSASGMDRYGITKAETSGLLKKAAEISYPSDSWKLIHEYANDIAYKLDSQKTSSVSETQGFTNAKLYTSTKNRVNKNLISNKVSQVNEGAISEYPYQIDDNFEVANTHPQYYQLAMEEDGDSDGTGDVVVWYCLDGSNPETVEDYGNEKNWATAEQKYYDNTKNDVRNNYYIYSYKNIIYTGVGHRNNITLMEKKLFVNTIIAAYNAQAVNPNLSFVNRQDMDAAEEEVIYYALDHSIQSDELLLDSQDFFLKVTDNNLVGTAENGSYNKPLELELFIDNPDKAGELRQLSLAKEGGLQILDAQGKVIIPDDTGKVLLKSGHVYKFTLKNLQQYLKSPNGGFKETVNLYAKVSCKYSYYGETRTAEATDQISINQRHLFDLD